MTLPESIVYLADMVPFSIVLYVFLRAVMVRFGFWS